MTRTGSMTLPKTYVGVDVAKDWIDVFTASDQRFHRVSNRKNCLAKWARNLKGDAMVIFEATGRYDRDLIACLEDLQVAYARVNPLRARQFARAAGLLVGPPPNHTANRHFGTKIPTRPSVHAGRYSAYDHC